MEASLKIRIPKPCHEDWNSMTPNQQGRFCDSCAKNVVDFTQMKTPDIQEYFLRNHGKKVCGRFNNDQLESIRIHIPVQIMYSQTQFHKIFLLALLCSMGTTLISCSDISGNRHNIESVEIVNDEKRDYETTMGASLNVDSTMIKKEPLRSVNTSLPNRKYATPIALKGDVIVESLNPEPTKEKKSEETTDIIHIDTIP